MHTKSGLLEQIQASTISLEEAGAATLDFLKEHIDEPLTVPLCGNSIGTDRRFLAAHLPEIEDFLHYRSIDVSTIKELARRWYPDSIDAAPKKAGGHRALDDIRESLIELRYFRERGLSQRGTRVTKPTRRSRSRASEEVTEAAPGVLRMQLPVHLPGLGHVNCYADRRRARRGDRRPWSSWRHHLGRVTQRLAQGGFTPRTSTR